MRIYEEPRLRGQTSRQVPGDLAVADQEAGCGDRAATSAVPTGVFCATPSEFIERARVVWHVSTSIRRRRRGVRFPCTATM